MVRPHLLGLPRDALGDGHRDHRRRLHALHGGVRHVLRHARRPSPQEAGDGHLLDHHPGRLRRVGRAVAAARRGPAGRLGQRVVLAVHRRDPGRRRRREPAQHRALHDRDPARPRGRPRQGQRPGGHRPGHLVHDHERLQRPERRAARHGVDPRDRARADRRRTAAPGADRGPRGRSRAGGGRAALRLPRGDLRDHRRPGAGRADPLHDVQQPGLRCLHRADGPLRPELFSVETWGIVLGVTGLGFVVGGGLVARFGLGPTRSAPSCSSTSPSPCSG